MFLGSEVTSKTCLNYTSPIDVKRRLHRLVCNAFPSETLKKAREIELKSLPSSITFYDYEVNIFLEEIYSLKIGQ